MDNVQIIILAAGKGTRMNSETPKPLIKLNGQSFLQHILDTISKLNLSIQPIIVIGHKKEKIKEILGDKHNYSEQREQLGTGHAVNSARNNLHPNHRIILVLSSDQPLISKETIENLISRHIERKSTITMGTIIVPDFEDWRIGMNHFGRIIRDTNGSVKKIVEFKDATEKEKESKEVNLALYAFDSEWLWKNIDKIKNENAKKEYYLTDIVKIAFEQNKKIEAIPIRNIIEGLHPNTKEELEILEKLVANQ